MVHAAARERGIGTGHLHQRQLGHPEGDGRHGGNLRLDPHRVGQLHHPVHPIVLDELGGDRVHGIGQRILERDHLPVGEVAVFGAPGVLSLRHLDAGLLVGQFRAGVEPQADGRGVDEGLERRPHLATGLNDVVKLGPLVIEIPDPRLHFPAPGVHAHQTGVQQGLLVADAVQWGHDRVDPSPQSHDPRPGLLFELVIQLPARHHRPRMAAPPFGGTADVDALPCTVLLGDVEAGALALRALLAHREAVATALFHAPLKDVFLLLRLDVRTERPAPTGRPLEVLPEILLELATDVPVGRFLGVALQTAVDGRVDHEAVAIQIIGSTVRLGDDVVATLILGVQQALDLRPQPLPEMGRRTLVVTHALVAEAQGQGVQAVLRGRRDHPVLDHLRNHRAPPLQHQLRPAQWVVQGAVLEHAHQHGGLVEVKPDNRFAEINLRRTADAHRLIQKVVAVQIQGDDLILGVLPLEPRGDDPLLGLLENSPFKEAGPVVALGEELLGQLLRHRAASALLAEVGNGPGKSAKVDAGVVPETDVLRTNEGLHQRGGQIGIPDIGPVLAVEAAQLDPVDSVDPGRQVGLRVGQSLGVGEVRRGRDGQQADDAEHRRQERQPHQDGRSDEPIPRRLCRLGFSLARHLFLVGHACETHGRCPSAPARCDQRAEKALKINAHGRVG